MQCIEQRYYIGALIGRIGQRWQPDPLLRRAAQGPVHHLSVQAGAMASLRILHEERLRLICATAARGQAYISDPADRELVARTATGRVLYAAQASGDVALPDCWPQREWRQLRASVREPGATWPTARTPSRGSAVCPQRCGGRTEPAPARSPSWCFRGRCRRVCLTWSRMPPAALARPCGSHDPPGGPIVGPTPCHMAGAGYAIRGAFRER